MAKKEFTKFAGVLQKQRLPTCTVGALPLHNHVRIDRIYQGRHHRDALGGDPDIPIIGEFVPGYETSSAFGIGAPRITPDKIVDKLNKKARLADLGGTVLAPLRQVRQTLGG